MPFCQGSECSLMQHKEGEGGAVGTHTWSRCPALTVKAQSSAWLGCYCCYACAECAVGCAAVLFCVIPPSEQNATWDRAQQCPFMVAHATQGLFA
eukprot:437230-Pelagomonas_calceolata.AAC.2